MKNIRSRFGKHLLKYLALALAALVNCADAVAASLELNVTLSSRSGPNYHSGHGTYTSYGGIYEVIDPASGVGLAYAPDGALGHFRYSIHGTQSIYDPVFDKIVGGSGIVSADWEHGGLHAIVGSNGDTVNQAYVHVGDTITFTNNTGQTQFVEIRFTIHGSMSAGAFYANDGVTILRYGRAACIAHLAFGGSGQGGTVNGQFGVDNDPANPHNNYGGITVSGWEGNDMSHQVTMDPGGKSGTFVGRFPLPPGERTYSLLQKIDLDVRFAAEANYKDTAGLEIVVPAGVSYATESGRLLTAGSRMVNISSRAEVRTADSVEIAGFIVTGTVPKKVIIRGIGPALGDLGVAGALADPVLELHTTNGGADVTLATNNNWRDSQQTEIQNTGIPPSKDLEAAIVRTLDPGSYTAILRGNNNGTGVGLIEVYDLEASVDSKLANISTRAFINTGDNVLIGGIIGGGNGSQPKVLIRAIGPSLTQFGVANALQDPLLELRNAQGDVLLSNNDWESDQKDAITATGLAPSNTKESAILATLLPTNYTAIVRGAGNTAGVGLVEVYHLQ